MKGFIEYKLKNLKGFFECLYNILYVHSHPGYIDKVMNKKNTYPNMLKNTFKSKDYISRYDFLKYADFKKYLKWTKIKSRKQGTSLPIVYSVNVFIVPNKKIKKLLTLAGQESEFTSNKWFEYNPDVYYGSNLIAENYYDIKTSMKRISKTSFVVFTQTNIKYEEVLEKVRFQRKDFRDRPKYIKGFKVETNSRKMGNYYFLEREKVIAKINQEISLEFLMKDPLYTKFIYNDYDDYYESKSWLLNSNAPKITLTSSFFDVENRQELRKHIVLPSLRDLGNENGYIINIKRDSMIFPYHYSNQTNPYAKDIVKQLKERKESYILSEKSPSRIRDIDLVLREFGETTYDMNELYSQYHDRKNKLITFWLSIIMLVISILTFAYTIFVNNIN